MNGAEHRRVLVDYDLSMDDDEDDEGAQVPAVQMEHENPHNHAVAVENEAANGFCRRFFADFPEDWRFGDPDNEYRFDRNGQLRDRNGELYVYDRERYETVAAGAMSDLHGMMRQYCGMQKHYLTAASSTRDDVDDAFFFASCDFETAENLVFLIHGTGAVRAGQWSRRLILNSGLAAGSQLGYVDECRKRGWGIVITDTNHTKSLTTGFPIKGSSTPEEHALNVWTTALDGARACHVAIVAHSYGGYVTEKIMHHGGRHRARLSAICLLDSGMQLKAEEMAFRDRICHWLASSKQLEEILPPRGGIVAFSAGTNDHDAVPVSAMNDVIAFIESVFGHVGDAIFNEFQK